MAVSLTGKVIITVVVLGVIGGMTATILLIVNNSNATESPEVPTTTDTPSTEAPPGDPPYHVGVGIADMTGPCVEINFMGYADFGQIGRGLHLRQFARTFIFVKGDTRIVLVATEVLSMSIAVRREVVRNLQKIYGEIYTLRNVIISGTHTHSTPGGHHVDFLLDISILGFSKETFDAYVAGITRSITRAHENIVPAHLILSKAQVSDAHINRSPYSYNYNPGEERTRYETKANDVLTQVRVVRPDGSLHGVLNWFAVHTTSMNMTNKLVSSDNLGYAALRMESELNPNTLAGKATVVAGFFSSNLGDVSPNTRGARCEFSGMECDNQFVLCEAGERCFSKGPGEDMFESTKLIGTTIYEGAMRALESHGEELTGDISVIHQFVEMPVEVAAKYDPITRTFNSSDPVRGCIAAIGYSFASGTIDGANTLNITQGTLQGDPLIDLITGVIARPTQEDIECHAPKPILLATGRANLPVPWHPRFISLSLIWLGGLVILGVPGEPTTMAGRRMKAVVGDVMERRGLERKIVISGLSNDYIHYVTTFEEYQVQRYEAASTIFGPNSLDIILNKFADFVAVAIEGRDVPPGPEPGDHRNNTLSIIMPVAIDNSPVDKNFGDVLEQPPSVARRGQTIQAVFVAANPRNDLKQEQSHALVERLDSGQWVVVANDADWNTKFSWERTSTSTNTSQVTFEWTVPENASPAPHRITYAGASRNSLGSLTHFSGVTNNFNIDI